MPDRRPGNTGRVLLTLTSTAPDATDLGFLLHKHPDRVQSFQLAFGTAHVFYPEAGPDRCTVALLLEVDPIRLVRGSGKGRGEGFALAQYVNDRPFAASSQLAVALGRVFNTALAGRCDARPELAATPLPLQVHLPALPARRGVRGQEGSRLGGPALVRGLFEPLGWQVQAHQPRLDPGFHWGAAPYVDTRLTGTLRLADALTQLYVLLPVLDDTKHYWVGQDEVDKLLRRGEGWLAGHPLRDLITRRYLAAQGRYVRAAEARLAELDERPDDAQDEPAEVGDTAATGERRVALKERRREAVLQALADVGARSVVDLGCGEGYHLQPLLADPRVDTLLGVDVAAGELARAERRLGLDRLPERQRAKLTLRQSSLTYRDDAVAGFDAALLVEVVEHIDPDRLATVERNVFGFARPGAVVVTTPNVEHNVRYGLEPGQLRHRDHRFEWTRAQFTGWARAVADRHGYTVEFRPVGDEDPDVGPPTQLALFRQAVTP